MPALAPSSDEPVADATESKTTELADDVPPVAEDTFLQEPEPAPAEPVIADLDVAKEVESHAAKLEVAPGPIETTTVILSAAYACDHSWLIHSCRPRKIPNIDLKSQPRSKISWPRLKLPRRLSPR